MNELDSLKFINQIYAEFPLHFNEHEICIFLIYHSDSLIGFILQGDILLSYYNLNPFYFYVRKNKNKYYWGFVKNNSIDEMFNETIFKSLKFDVKNVKKIINFYVNNEDNLKDLLNVPENLSFDGYSIIKFDLI